jgi:hypothetical protein
MDLSLAGLTAAAFAEGIKFLYDQAGEALKRRHAKHDASAAEPIAVERPDIIEGKLAPLVVDRAEAERRAADLERLWSTLALYVQGVRPVDPADTDLIAAAGGLRSALEDVFHQRITFAGEDREPSGPIVRGTAKAETVRGEQVGVRAKRITGDARVEGEATATSVEEGGVQAGLKADTIGD